MRHVAFFQYPHLKRAQGKRTDNKASLQRRLLIKWLNLWLCVRTLTLCPRLKLTLSLTSRMNQALTVNRFQLNTSQKGTSFYQSGRASVMLIGQKARETHEMKMTALDCCHVCDLPQNKLYLTSRFSDICSGLLQELPLFLWRVLLSQ